MGEIANEAVDVCRFLQQAGHGTVHRCIPLRGDLTLPDGRTAPAWLCQTRMGVWIASAIEEQGKLIDVLAAHPVGYEERLLGDRLTVGLLQFTIPYGKGAAARTALAMGRLLRDAAFPVFEDAALPKGPWIEEIVALEAVWLRAQLSPEDTLLAWLHTSTPANLETPLHQGAAPSWRLLISEQRAELVAVSRVGDVARTELPLSSLEVVEQTGRNEVCAGNIRWSTTLSNGARFLAIARLPGLQGAARLREAARLVARGGSKGAADEAQRLLTTNTDSTDAIDVLLHATLHGVKEDALLGVAKEVVDALKTTDPDSQRLVDWLVGWSPDTTLAVAILDAIIVAGDGPETAAWGLPYHRALRDRLTAQEDDAFERAALDIALAEHLLYAGQPEEAARRLEARLSSLPDEDLALVLPPEQSDLTSGEGGQAAHIRVLELLVRARGEQDTADLATVALLARHQPLVAHRLDALIAATPPGNLRERARRARALLAPGGLGTPPVFDARPSRPLPADLVELLQHPVARSGGALARVQAALAKVEPPDVGVLRRYCERLTTRLSEAAVAAVADACVMLGTPAIPTFVSQGEHRTGLRSHERPEPFLLIGGDHLNPDSDLALQPAELRFLIGAEVAHVRFGHSRITSDEVWAGVWDKGTTALTATASILPFLRYLPVDLIGNDRTYRAVRTIIPERWLRTIYGVSETATLAKAVTNDLGKLGDVGAGAFDFAGSAASRVRRLTTTSESAPAIGADIGPDDRRLVAAHRVMQITADRVGLVLCGDLGAAIRAMFLAQARLRPELGIAERVGLTEALRRRTPTDQAVLPGFAVRVAALTAFWLSDDYARLRQAIGAIDHLALPSRTFSAPPLEPEEIPATRTIPPPLRGGEE